MTENLDFDLRRQARRDMEFLGRQLTCCCCREPLLGHGFVVAGWVVCGECWDELARKAKKDAWIWLEEAI